MAESITIRQAKRLAKSWAKADGTTGYVVKAAGVLHATTDAAELKRVYGDRFEGIVWTTAE